jgi:hypothetical protein
MLVLTADQKRSTQSGDRVPAALQALGTDPPEGVRLPFERTVGDEIQGVLSTPAAAVWAVTELVRLGDWRIGIGVGPVEQPLPDSTRAASGPAFVAARDAVTAAHTSPTDLRVRSAVGARDYPSANRARAAESALWLLVALLRRRTPEGWEIVQMAGSGLSGREMAARLDISPSAVSQRLARAGAHEGRRGAELAALLLAEAETEAQAPSEAGA